MKSNRIRSQSYFCFYLFSINTCMLWGGSFYPLRCDRMKNCFLHKRKRFQSIDTSSYVLVIPYLTQNLYNKFYTQWICKSLSFLSFGVVIRRSKQRLDQGLLIFLYEKGKQDNYEFK